MNPCVQDILDNAAGKISEREAGKLLRDLTNKAKALADEQGITLAEAAKIVTEEAAKAEKMKAALSYRATMLNYRAMFNAKDAITAGVKNRRDMGQALVDYLNQAYNNGHYQAGKVLNRLFTELQAAGVLDAFNKGGEALSRDVYQERWQLSAGQPFVTKNKVAQKIASIIVPIRKEINAKLRLLGADIRDDQFYAGPQTHNPEIMRRAGAPTGVMGWMFGKENSDAAFDVWEKHVTSLNIDWAKTVAGTTESERQRFLRDFFESIYSGVHGGPVEVIDPGKVGQGGYGSLVEKIEAHKLLWFADAKSQWEYNQRWGIKDFNGSILSEIQNAHRQMTMLQHLGTSPGNVFQNVVRKARESAKSMTDSQAQVRSLEAERVQGSYDTLAGKAGTTRYPWRSLFFSSVKDWVTASKGGAILFSMTGDPAFMRSELALQGFSAMDQLSTPFHLGLLNTAEGKEFLQNAGFLAHAWSGQTAERWSNDVHPNRKTAKLAEWVFKYGGVTSVTDKERALMTLMTSHKLGQEASSTWNNINPRTRSILERYQFTPAEWEAMRATAYKVGDDLPVLSPDRMQEIPDATVDALLEAKDTQTTPAARSLLKLDLEAKLGAYIHDRTLAGVPTPGLREREFMTGHATPRGEWSRELRDLFFIFKGFPITVTMRNKEAFGILAQGEGKFSAFRHVANLVAQSAAMGYIGLTARELLKGKEPRKLVQDGELNWKLFLESMQRGGGAGIYGDYLFSEYDSRTKGFLKAVAGPALGELETFANAFTKGRRALYDEHGDRLAESLGYDAARFAENNAPLLNLFYTKFFLDQFILWHLKEGLSPGVVRRTQKYDRDQNWQEWWMDPVQ